MDSLRIAVLLPCYNEEAAIGATVAGFREALPEATIYVYDNNSRDRTREIAAEADESLRAPGVPRWRTRRCAASPPHTRDWESTSWSGRRHSSAP